jgi:Transposase DDE domain
MRQGPVALRERGRLAALVSTVVHQARRQAGWREPDRRTSRTWRQLVLGLVVARSTRLVTVGQAVLGQRAARSVKAVAMALGYFLTVAKFPAQTVSTRVLEAAVRQLDPAQVATYRGKAVVALDPTEYPKRSRGQSKRGRHMEHVGRVRKPTKGGGRKRRAPHPRPRRAAPPGASPAPRDAGTKAAARVATTAGYVDVWAGLVLTGQQLLPLARALFSNRHPTLLSQNQIEGAALDAALALLKRLGWAAILVADRGFGRKELLVALATRRAPPQDFVIRVDADVTVFTAALPAGALLGPVLAAQPVVGEVVWDRGQEGPLRCAARTVTAAIRFSRTGRRDDSTAATLHFVELLPLDGVTDPLVLATTLPVATLGDVKGVVRVYAWRWAIETAFETMKAWGLGRFMVRSWQAIDRLLWLVAVAYALLVVAVRDGPLTLLREQAAALLKRLAVLGRRLTVGKLAEAIGLDYHRHRRAWATCWLTCT